MNNHKYWALAIGGPLGIAASLFGLGYMRDVEHKGIALQIKAQQSYALQERDLDKNGLPERFIEINGVKYFLTVNGKNLEKTLERK